MVRADYCAVDHVGGANPHRYRPQARVEHCRLDLAPLATGTHSCINSSAGRQLCDPARAIRIIHAPNMDDYRPQAGHRIPAPMAAVV